MKKQKRYIFTFDLDQTLFKTFSPPPGGIDTVQAYQKAVHKIFGAEGSKVYTENGGLRNRSPGEVVAEIIKKKPQLIHYAHKFFWDNFKDEGSLCWKDDTVLATITEMLVQIKLRYLSDQISAEWPKPYPGVIELINSFQPMRHCDEILIDFTILSSGHECFIHKTFEQWNLPKPKVMVTDDDIRHRQKPSLKARVKPAPFPFRLLQLKLLQSELKNGSEKEIIYFGDDPNKDGGLARNVNVPFGWFNPLNQKHHLPFPNGSFSFSSWEKLNLFLNKIETRTQLYLGASLSEVFSTF